MWRFALGLAVALVVVQVVSTVSAFVVVQRQPSADLRASLGAPVMASSIFRGGSASLKATKETAGVSIHVAVAAFSLLAGALGTRRKQALTEKIRGRGARSLVVCQAKPSFNQPRQKVLRKLSRFGPLPGWTAKPLLVRRKNEPWRKIFNYFTSEYKRKWIEKRRVLCNYNIREKELKKYFSEALVRGNEHPVERLMQLLEGRFDSVIYRVGLACSLPDAQHRIASLAFEYKKAWERHWRPMDLGSYRMNIGDMFRVKDKQAVKDFFKMRQGWRQTPNCRQMHNNIPPHIDYDPELMQGMYLGPCHRNDFMMPVEEQTLASYYLAWGNHKRNGIRKDHKQIYPGTNIPIPKKPHAGRPRPTIKNIINMTRGVGLEVYRGKNKPPCLWGRKFPLNNPYVKHQFGRHQGAARWYTPERVNLRRYGVSRRKGLNKAPVASVEGPGGKMGYGPARDGTTDTA